MIRYATDHSCGHREYWKQIREAVRNEEQLQTETEASGLAPDIDLESLSLEELDRLTAPNE